VAEKWTCPEHGTEYGHGVPDWTTITPACPDCLKVAHAEEQRLHHAHRAYLWWREDSNVPRRCRSALAGAIHPVDASAKRLATAVGQYAEHVRERYREGSGLVLLGPPGTGKTLALAALVNEVCKLGFRAQYMAWPEALTAMKDGMRADASDPRRGLLDSLKSVDLLALDELAVRVNATDWEMAQLFELIDARYRQELPTLVASNATRATLPQAVGDRVADRLIEMGPTLVLTGSSQRGKIACSGPPAMSPPPDQATARIHCNGEWTTRQFNAPDFAERYLP